MFTYTIVLNLTKVGWKVSYLDYWLFPILCVRYFSIIDYVLSYAYRRLFFQKNSMFPFSSMLELSEWHTTVIRQQKSTQTAGGFKCIKSRKFKVFICKICSRPVRHKKKKKKFERGHRAVTEAWFSLRHGGVFSGPWCERVHKAVTRTCSAGRQGNVVLWKTYYKVMMRTLWCFMQQVLVFNTVKLKKYSSPVCV